MRDGISGAALPSSFPYADIINELSAKYNVSPLLVGAIKVNETGLGQGPATEQVISEDGGHGVMQLTSSYPVDWINPTANIEYAISNYIVPAWTFWRTMEQGSDLVRCIAASYNAGIGGAEAGHNRGNVDMFTTNDYGERALTTYTELLEGESVT